MFTQADWKNQVLFKTEKAHIELAERTHGLRPKARQLLILLDGERALGSLESLLPQQELLFLVGDLQSMGFISTRPMPPSASLPIATPPIPAPEPLDPVRLTRAKAYLIEISQQHLGLLASQLQRKIAEASSTESMRSALAHWNMALLESRTGSDMAGACLKKAHEIIGWESA